MVFPGRDHLKTEHHHCHGLSLRPDPQRVVCLEAMRGRDNGGVFVCRGSKSTKKARWTMTCQAYCR